MDALVTHARWTIAGFEWAFCEAGTRADCSRVILDEPTKGIDIAAKQDIYELIRELARDGMAVLVISSESEEIQMLSDRVVVMREGAVTHDGLNQGMDDQTLLQYAMGVA